MMRVMAGRMAQQREQADRQCLHRIVGRQVQRRALERQLVP